MKSKEIEGQMNLFGNEPYQPKKAVVKEAAPVVLDTEAEEFLSVGRKRKKEESPKPEEAKPIRPRRKPAGYSVVMQRSFQDDKGGFATAAYVDYNMVYVQESSGKAEMKHYLSSKAAVNAYLNHVGRFEKTDGLKRTEENPALQKVQVKEAAEQ